MSLTVKKGGQAISVKVSATFPRNVAEIDKVLRIFMLYEMLSASDDVFPRIRDLGGYFLA